MPVDSDTITRVWEENTYLFDDAIRSDSETFDEFLKLDNQHQQRVARNLLMFEEETDFKALRGTSNYQWLFDPKSYTFGAEVMFQFRVLKLLIQFKGLDFLSTIPPIVVREAVIPTMRLSFPRTLFTDDISFIVLPMGWLEMNNYLSYGIKQANKEKKGLLYRSVLELQLRFLADDILQEYLLTNVHRGVDQHLMALVKIELGIRLKNKIPLFKEALGDILPGAFTGLYERFTYGCETFTLAHEIAHILHSEHESNREPDEHRADEIAIAILLKSNSQTILGGGLEASAELSLLLAVTMFNMLGNLHFKLLAIRAQDTSHQAEAFKKRSLATGKQMFKHKLVEKEDQVFRSLLFHLKTYTQTFDKVLRSVLEQESVISKEGHQILSDVFEDD